MEKNKGITLVALAITIIILLLLAGIAIASLGENNGIVNRVKKAREEYNISEAKEKLELAISNLRIEEEGKGENLEKEDLPKINNNEIDVRDTTDFPVEVIYINYKFEIDSNFQIRYIGKANETVITYTTEPKSYTNQNKIKVLIKITSTNGIKSILKPGEDDAILPQNQTTVGIDFTVSRNGHYTLKVVDNENNETFKDIYIDLIDTLEPLEFTPKVQKSGNNINIIENGQDAEATEDSSKSGIKYYEYYLVNEKGNITKYETNKIENLTLGNYKIYVIAYDKAGNHKQSNIVDFKINREFKEISLGSSHSLAIDNEGQLWAWGDNRRGQLGDGTTNSKNVPTIIETNIKFIKVSAGSLYSIAIDTEGNLWSWGQNDQGQLGDGTTSNKNNPTKITENIKYKEISAGNNHCIAIDNEGQLWTWGDNSSGQLGDGTTISKNIPNKVEFRVKFCQAQASSRLYSMAIDNEGNLWSWGLNDEGQLGAGTTINKNIPTKIEIDTTFKKFSIGETHSIAVDNRGNLWAWGDNYYGELGDKTTKNKLVPTKIKEDTIFQNVLAGSSFSIGIDENYNLWTWGTNDKGQLGINSKQTQSSIPINIMKNNKFIEIYTGNAHCIAKDNEWQLWTWGYNSYGQLGDKTTMNKLAPVEIK